MLTIYMIPEQADAVEAAILSVNRLHEVVTLEELGKEAIDIHPPALLVTSAGISIPLLWDQSLPPYLLPDTIEFSQKNLLGLIFHFLENDEQSWDYLKGMPLYGEIAIQNKLKYGIAFQIEELLPPDGAGQYRVLHNQAILRHYGQIEVSSNGNGNGNGNGGGSHHVSLNPEKDYLKALKAAPYGELKAFTARELGTWYLDNGNLDEAIETLEEGLEAAFSGEAKQALNLVLIKVLLEKLVAPLDLNLLMTLQTKIRACLDYYGDGDNEIQAGLLLMDAMHLSLINEKYSEGLSYIGRAVSIFENAALEELKGMAFLKKGNLLSTWAQNGNPQFYQPAIESYKQALAVYTRETRPDIFADIQHHLAVIYAAMP